MAYSEPILRLLSTVYALLAGSARGHLQRVVDD